MRANESGGLCVQNKRARRPDEQWRSPGRRADAADEVLS